MTLEQLKEKVHALIRNGQTEAALEAVGAWADAHQQAQVKKEVTLLMASWWDLNRDKRRGLIDNAEAAMRTNQTHDRILESLESIKGESGEDAPAPVSGLPEDVVYEFLAYLLENKDKNRWVETQNGFAKPRGWSEFKMNDLVSEFEKRGWVGDVVKVARNWPQLRITIKGEFEFERLKANMEKNDKKPANTPLSIFISYSKKDNTLREELDVHLSPLRRRGIVANWDDRHLLPGELWDDTIKSKLKAADIILFLVSADFINTDYIWEHEIPLAEAQWQAGKARVIPIILKPCQWTELDFAKHQALPSKGVPISLFADKDAAWNEVVEAIKRIFHEMKNNQ